ncbi:MAG: sugar transferase [Alphaproteobacteria bacterium]|nr:MAG: sugar transferase [Alphaproteobacteria bacterium]
MKMLPRIASALVLVSIFPLLSAIALAILICGRKPLFLQTRVGLHHELFRIIKFRTIDDASASLDPAWRSACFKRLAHFLRRTRLDELPQLANVMLGQMSLVGPRPLKPDDLADMAAPQTRRQEVKPGITGLSQLCGGDLLPKAEKLRLDLYYVENRSMMLDLRIIGATLPGLMRGIDFDCALAATTMAEQIGAYAVHEERSGSARAGLHGSPGNTPR